MARNDFRPSSVVSKSIHVAKIVDLAIVLLSGWLAFYFCFSSLTLYEERYSWTVLVGTLLASFLFPFFSIYPSWKGVRLKKIVVSTLAAYAIWISMVIVVLFVFKLSDKFSRTWIILWGIEGFFASILVRLLFLVAYRKVLLKRKYSVLLIGDEGYCSDICNSLSKDKNAEFKVSRVFVKSNKNKLAENWFLYQNEKELDVFEEEVWICLPISQGQEVISITRTLYNTSLNVRFMPGMQELRLINHKVSNFSGVHLIDISCSPMTRVKRIIKRAEDIFLSLCILITIMPLMAILCIGVKLTSPGPIFYRQSRVSWNNRVFGMLKFRSMSIDNEDDSVEWGNATQKKVTSFGKFIRKTSLDELPQFLNVLKGDMSIVGPRPERDIFVEKFGEEIPGYMQKHMVKAGITGWAQIHGLRGDTSLEKRIEYDLWYIENWSLWLDIKIIFMTFSKVLFDKSAA